MKLFKKRWHRLPIGILTVILLACLIAGSAFAAYTVLTGTTEVDVQESIRAEFAVFGDWFDIEDEFVMTLESYYPGETDIGYYRIYNKSSVALPVAVTITGIPLDWELVGSSVDLTRSGGIWTGLVTVPAAVDSVEGTVEFTIEMTVPTDVEPTLYTFGYAIARQ